MSPSTEKPELANLWASVTFNGADRQLTVVSFNPDRSGGLADAQRRMPGLPVLQVDLIGMSTKTIYESITEFLVDQGLVGVELQEVRSTLLRGLHEFITEKLDRGTL